MGTNYYIMGASCPTCGHESDRLHIGKSSAGWCFALHVTEELKTLDDWKAKFDSGVRIQDEYGNLKTADEMMAIIVDRDGGSDWSRKYWHGYKSEEDFHILNQSERGPKNLLRQRINGRYCIGHGEGTWDYVLGIFS